MTKRLVLLILVAAVIGGGGYALWRRAQSAQTTPQAAAPAQPPPEVGYVTVTKAEVPIPLVYAGRVAGYRDIEIRAQVSGILVERLFEDGAKIEKGQALFRIDRRPFEVARDRANAQLAQAQATARQADDNFRRVEELARRQVSTEQQLEQARATRDQSQAGVQLAQSELNSAELNLGYTTINAPVTGTTALTSPPVGSLIQSQQTLLTTLTQLDPAYVNFSVTDSEYQRFRELNQQRAKPISESDLEVKLQYGSGDAYRETGRVQVSASTVDTRTGTVQVRAIFPNAAGDLLPGQFVRVMISGVTLPNTVTVPKQAISQGPQGPFVYVVDDKQTAQARPVKLGAELTDSWVLESGLNGDERIIVDGIIRTRPGAPVRATPFKRNGEGGR